MPLTLIKEVRQQLDTLRAKRKASQPLGGPEYRRLVAKLFSFDLLDELGSIYLDPNTTSQQREEIRVLAWNDENIIGQLMSYIQRAAEQLGSTRDEKWLRLGLAAASIENLQLDFRDTCRLLGFLYITATHAGMDPVPTFQAVARLSSGQPDTEAFSMSDLLENFHKSDYFAESVRPSLSTLPTLNSPGLYRCRVCGLEYDEPPWGEDGTTPTFDICGCCGVQFGYEDCTLKGIRQYREQWLAKGARWLDPKLKPGSWSLEEQLRYIPPEFQ